jgi:anti-anti-sigma factor
MIMTEPFVLPRHIDVTTAREVERRLQAHVEELGDETPDRPVVLDCSELRCIDSSGLDVLARTSARMRPLVLANCAQTIRDRVSRAGLVELLTLV